MDGDFKVFFQSFTIMFKFGQIVSNKQIKWAQSSMSTESCEAKQILVLCCAKQASWEDKKHRKMSLKRRQGWGSCHLNLNVALILHHTEINIRASPCVLIGSLSSFDTYSQMQWSALWKFQFLSTDYRKRVNSPAADSYTEALILAKA